MRIKPVRTRCLLILLLFLGLLPSACAGSTRPTIKISLVAPFEGRYRDVGYEVIYAVRLAVREANAAGGVAGYSVELIAFDDSGDPIQAREQASKVDTDPQVMAVIGHWLPATTEAAAAIYEASDIPYLITAEVPADSAQGFHIFPTPTQLDDKATQFANSVGLSEKGWIFCMCEDIVSFTDTTDTGAHKQATLIGPPIWGQTQFWALHEPEGAYFIAPAPRPAEAAGGDAFAARYLEISNGVQPGSLAVLAYDATQVALDALVRDIAANGAPSRAGVATALAVTDLPGLSGRVSFDAEGHWREPATHVYQWQQGQIYEP